VAARVTQEVKNKIEGRLAMTVDQPDFNPPPEKPEDGSPEATDQLASQIVIGTPVPGSIPPEVSISLGELESAPPQSPLELQLPEDLRISWSWLHLVAFAVFGVISLVAVQTAFAIYYTTPNQHFANKQEFEQFVMSKPFFAVGSMVIWEALLILFLFVTIAVLPNAPFWSSLGWRKIAPADPVVSRKPWVYLLSGSALSICVFIVTATAKAPDDAPIQEVLKHRSTAIFFMAMAVLVAPFIEETLFRGYLYPLIARFISGVAGSYGFAAPAATRIGITSGVILTGTLFGLIHGYQLGWSLALVFTLIGVGIVLTYVRARTGTVFASYLLHLGYNSTIALVTIVGFIATKGFTKLPPGN
jgi:membrane protease YdiL (CAAX protease family)